MNHIIDPTFFYDAIEEFAFNYDIATICEKDVDDYGNEKFRYRPSSIRGSLQPKEQRLNQSKEGNTQSLAYDFYCKSLYRINEGDYIYYKGRGLRVKSVVELDEFGVRECHLECTDLVVKRNLDDYVNYLNGDELV